MERLNDNEVREVAQMQKKIDSYESFICALNAMVVGKRTDLNYLLFEDTPLTNEMNKVWRFVKEKVNDGKENNRSVDLI